MSARKKNERWKSIQKNTLESYMPAYRCNVEKDVVRPLIEEMISTVVKADKLKKRKHDGTKVREKTLDEWKVWFPWLSVEKVEDEIRLNCNMCREAAEPCKLSTIWAFEGIELGTILQF